MSNKGFSKWAFLMLWIAAIIWGFAFVAQRAGMKYIGPFTYSGIRFLLGSLSLLPLLYYEQTKKKKAEVIFKFSKAKTLALGVSVGLVLFAAASLQQVGLVYTSAGKAGFITGFYVVLVPIIGIFLGQKITRFLWIGTLLALTGLYFLTISGSIHITYGDFLILLCAFFWAFHVQIINALVKNISPILLSVIQFTTCGILSLIVAFSFETISLQSIYDATIPILYGGLLSVGVAYTLQVVAQQYVQPAHASLILTFETVFAVIGGWLILHEKLTLQNLIGCAFMLAGLMLVQLTDKKKLT